MTARARFDGRRKRSYLEAFEYYGLLCADGSRKFYGGLDHYLRLVFSADMRIQSRVAMVLLE